MNNRYLFLVCSITVAFSVGSIWGYRESEAEPNYKQWLRTVDQPMELVQAEPVDIFKPYPAKPVSSRPQVPQAVADHSTIIVEVADLADGRYYLVVTKKGSVVTVDQIKQSAVVHLGGNGDNGGSPNPPPPAVGVTAEVKAIVATIQHANKAATQKQLHDWFKSIPIQIGSGAIETVDQCNKTVTAGLGIALDTPDKQAAWKPFVDYINNKTPGLTTTAAYSDFCGQVSKGLQ